MEKRDLIGIAIGLIIGFVLGFASYAKNTNKVKDQKEILKQMEFKNDSLKIQIEIKKQDKMMKELDEWLLKHDN